MREPKKVRTDAELIKSCRMLREHNERLKGRVAELEETNRAYKEAWSVNIFTNCIEQLESELAFCQRIIKQGSDDLTGEQVAYIFDLPENQHE